MKLTDREQRVLYGLVRWPHATDVVLGEALGLGRTTVTVVRQRLAGKGFFSTHYVPDFAAVGCELLTALYGEFSVGGGVVDGLTESLRDGVSHIFYMVKAGGRHLSLGAAENITRVREHILSHHRIHHESGYLTDKRHNYVFFPLEQTRIPRYFDYAPLLAEHFGLEHEKAGERREHCGSWMPTVRERDTFHMLLRHPDSTDEDVAVRAGVSRQTVNALRNRFIDKGLLRAVRVPDVAKLGYGLLAFTHLHMNPHASQKDIKKNVNNVLGGGAHVLKVMGDLESVLLSVHWDYGGYDESRRKMVDCLRKNNIILEDPVTHLYPLPQTEQVITHEYDRIIPATAD